MSRRGPQVVGPKIEQALCKELGVDTALAWTVEGEDRGATVRDGLVGAFGGSLKAFEYVLEYKLPSKLDASVQVGVVFAGVIGWIPGPIVFSSKMDGKLQEPVQYSRAEGLLGRIVEQEFAGDAQAASKLNGSAEIVRETSKLLIAHAQSGNISLQVAAKAIVAPAQNGSIIKVATLQVHSLWIQTPGKGVPFARRGHR